MTDRITRETVTFSHYRSFGSGGGPATGRGTRMTVMLARWITAAHADRLVVSFHVVLTVSVFAFLALMVLA